MVLKYLEIDLMWNVQALAKQQQHKLFLWSPQALQDPTCCGSGRDVLNVIKYLDFNATSMELHEDLFPIKINFYNVFETRMRGSTSPTPASPTHSYSAVFNDEPPVLGGRPSVTTFKPTSPSAGGLLSWTGL